MLSVAKVAPEGRSLSRPCHRLLLFDGMFLVGRNVMQNVSSIGRNTPSISVGDRFTNRYGCEAEVIKYESAKAVTVKFLDSFGYELTTTGASLRNTNFKNPYHPTICGIGYLGDGPHLSRVKGRYTLAYSKWYAMIQRCYAEIPGKHLTYRGCTVVVEWLNFQTFADWFFEQKIVGDMQIDKDILRKSNRIYSPENCRMVPTEINKAMTGGKKNRDSDLPTGVSLHTGGRFTAQITTSSKRRYLGIFDTVEEAFAVYKFEKELHIRQLAEEYKDVLVPEIYEAMMNWEVLITD